MKVKPPRKRKKAFKKAYPGKGEYTLSKIAIEVMMEDGYSKSNKFIKKMDRMYRVLSNW